MIITPITFDRGELLRVLAICLTVILGLCSPIFYGMWYVYGRGVDPAEKARLVAITRTGPEVAARDAIGRGDMRLMVTCHPRRPMIPGEGEPASRDVDHSKYIYLPGFHTDLADNGHQQMRLKARRYARRYNAPIILLLREQRKALLSSAR